MSTIAQISHNTYILWVYNIVRVEGLVIAFILIINRTNFSYRSTFKPVTDGNRFKIALNIFSFGKFLFLQPTIERMGKLNDIHCIGECKLYFCGILFMHCADRRILIGIAIK